MLFTVTFGLSIFVVPFGLCGFLGHVAFGLASVGWTLQNIPTL